MKEVKLYNNCPNKRYVMQSMMHNIAGIDSNAVVLLGPSCEDYIKSLIANVCSRRENKIYSYENDWQAYKEQINIINSLPLNIKSKIVPNYCSVDLAEPQRFIDLDLMATIRTQANLITNLFKSQYKVFKDFKERKAFIFNVSSHGTEILTTLAFIEKLLNLHIYKHFVAKNKYCSEYTFFTDSKEFVIKAYSYCDSSSMLNILIQY